MSTLIEIITNAENTRSLCAGAAVIEHSKFSKLAEEIEKCECSCVTKEEVEHLFIEQSRRFSACGANNSDKFGVLRKNKSNGWEYLVTLIEHLCD